MTSERWRQVEEIYHSALEREEGQRAGFLKEACAGDEALRREVESLLAHKEKAESFIETSALKAATKGLVEDQPQSLVGRQLGSYKILSQLGAGGMGEVYLAQDTRLDRAIALKILPAGVASNQDRMRRFIREAKSASALKHPNVAHIYEIGELEGVNFIAMEYVEGQTLAAKIDGRPLDSAEIVEISRQVADALDEAQSKGITHRDIKPANLMLTSRGQVKVLDFGLAKIAQPEGQAVASNMSTVAKTEMGVVMGTVEYMSPEQVLGREVDHRTDIFSLGVVLYEMATGRRPFSGTTATETIDQILHAQPEAVARFNYNVPAELERIVGKCLEKDRERRYQSARELLFDLRNLERDRGSGAAFFSALTPSRNPVKRITLAISAAVALIFIAGLTLMIRHFLPWPARPTVTVPSNKRSLAVMYFDNLSQDQGLRWLERGVTEMLTTNLAQFQNLEVLSSQRLFDIIHTLGKEKLERIDRRTATEVARKANVQAVVSGSILKVDSKIRLNVVLEGMDTGRVLFSDKVDGDNVQEIFHMVDELTMKIAVNYGVAPSPVEKTPSISEMTTHSVEAFKLYQQGIENSGNLNIFEAIRNFEGAIAIDPQFALSYMRLSWARWADGNTEGSRQAIVKAVEYIDRVGDKEELFIRGMAAQIKGEWKTAIGVFERIAAAYPNDKEPFIWLGWSYQMGGQMEKAIESLKRAIELDPNFAQAFNALGYHYTSKGDYQNAVASFKRYVELRPQEANAHDSLGDGYTRMGRYENALTEYRAALSLKPDLVDFWEYLKIGIVFRLKGDESQAEEYVRKYLSLTKDAFKPSGYSVLAQIAISGGKSKSARSYWEQAVKAAKRSRTDWAIAFTLIYFSEYHLFFKRHQEALQLAEEARSRFQEIRSGPLIARQAAKALAACGKYTESLKSVENYLAIHPDKVTPSVANEMREGIKGFIAYEKENFPEAIAFWQPIAKDRRGASLYYLLGRAYFQSGQWREAEQAYLEALNRRKLNLEFPFMVYYYPEHEFVLAHYYLGRIYEATGRTSEAVENYQKFLSRWQQADFPLPEISDARVRLKKLA
jgi:serine/threonine protein kinase/tetratricopeptide (TPR) repeat protein